MTDIFDQSAPVYVRVDGAVGRIVLNRLEKRNAMSEAMWAAIPNAVKILEQSKDVRVIVLCSSGAQAFSAGADISELEVISSNADRRESNRLAIRNAQRVLARATKPTIAEISGPCIGGGCGLAIHCDFRIAADTAKFGITPAKLGIIYPLNDTKQLMDLVGVSKAKSLLFTGRIVNAADAFEMGLIDEVCQVDALAEQVIDLASHLASVSQYSLQGMKQSIQRILDGQVDDDSATSQQFIDAHEGVDAQEGVRAFLEKRTPAFTWNGES
jgi:enoyl-CoA hydratase/carnithine racemase